MTRVHDMGGRFGDGPVVPEPGDRAVIAKDWHRRALALTLAGGATGLWPLDQARRAREQLAPKDYARFSYYEKWLAGLADLLVETGAVTPDELAIASERVCDDSATPGGSAPALSDRALRAENVAALLARGGPSARASDVPVLFVPGQQVRTLRPAANRHVPGGHTRLPAYAAGATGTVLRCHGAHVFPDTNAHGLGEAPQPLYAVTFPASQLWANPEHPRDSVVIDLWQSYLEAV